MKIESISSIWSQVVWLDTLVALLITVAAYVMGSYLYKKANQNPLLLPLVVASFLIALLLYSYPAYYGRYIEGSVILYYALGPATVALAVPLYQQLMKVREVWLPVAIVLVIGSSVATAIAVLMAWGLQGSDFFIKSIAAKSVTTPIAMQIAQVSGGDATLAAAVVAMTGVAGALGAQRIFTMCAIEDPRLKGLVLVVCAHAVGTVKAFEISPVAGAFSSLAMGVCGVLAAFILPIILLQA